MVKKLIFSFLISLFFLFAQTQTKYPTVVMETNFGTIKIVLYDKTIKHSDNFVKLVNEGYYNGLLFHRVIKDFMIQTGDDKSKNSAPGQPLGFGGKNYTISAEFFPDFIHKKGALAAARQGDNVNPQKASSGSQFYIVQGRVYKPEELQIFIDRGLRQPFSENEISIYSTIGGVPHLDFSYTVFGEVSEGLDIVEKISQVSCDGRDRPIEDVIILKMYTED